MEMHSTQPSSVVENGTALDTSEVEWNPDQIEWNEEISLEEAKALLEKTMYPFKKVRPCVSPPPSHFQWINGIRWSTDRSWKLSSWLK